MEYYSVLKTDELSSYESNRGTLNANYEVKETNLKNIHT